MGSKQKPAQERLTLLMEAREKIAQMKKINVFTMDLSALRMLEKLTAEFQELMLENLKLQKELKVQSLRLKAKSKK